MTFLASQRENFDLILSPQLTPISKLPVQGMGGYDLWMGWMDGWMDGHQNFLFRAVFMPSQPAGAGCAGIMSTPL